MDFGFVEVSVTRWLDLGEVVPKFAATAMHLSAGTFRTNIFNISSSSIALFIC